ncbi:ribose 5-phosphate isomerase A [Gracilibacillus sp. YIM 98692]|uniref:ribose 5-phosphate isomerase A n=1 Tax=Gracilibacillus sp. YIM 98692 TaxID=2663532 RepID=UPI0013D8A266|nr:ribose 5-phosphate isomerase A [Gracilibacillus sp. YIM 98692]
MDYNKKIAGEEAVNEIKDGMTIGLGSGSTVNWMLKRLADRIEKEGLTIRGIPSSIKTECLARELGIPLTDFTEVEHIDLAIDGADEVDPQLQLLKGGGGSLVREKIVDTMAEKLIIIVDESKVVQQLGTFPLPIEVLPFGWNITAKQIALFGCVPTLRKKGKDVFISDNGNYILDCTFHNIMDPKALHEKLKLLVGVVETGFFIDMADKVIEGRNGKIEIWS